MKHYTNLLKNPDAAHNMALRYPIEVRAVPAGFEYRGRRVLVPQRPVEPKPPSNADLRDVAKYRKDHDEWFEANRAWERDYQGHEDFCGMTQTTIPPNERRPYVELTLCVDGSHPQGWGNPYATRGAVQVDANMDDDFGGDGVRAYFLPWNPTGGIVQMTIPRSTSTDLDTHPCVFFTSAIAGCSVIVKGTAHEPTIIHGGTSMGSPGYDANRFWRDLVEYADQHPDEGLKYADRHRPIETQVSKSRYVSGLPNRQTARSRALGHDLGHAYGQEIELAGVHPWGCVFGIRQGMNWQFYLQENANIEYYVRHPRRVYKRTLFGKRKSEDFWERASEKIVVSRAMALTEIFPGGGARAMLPYRFRTLSRMRSNQLITAPGAHPVN